MSRASPQADRANTKGKARLARVNRVERFMVVFISKRVWFGRQSVRSVWRRGGHGAGIDVACRIVGATHVWTNAVILADDLIPGQVIESGW